MCIHLIRSLCALRMASFFFLPPRTRLLLIAGLRCERESSRWMDSPGVRGSGNTNSNKDDIVASLTERMYLAGEISERGRRGPSHSVSSFITHPNDMVKIYRHSSRTLI